MKDTIKHQHDDALARAKALDLNTSIIVQAPAGSGKTELLTQRFLKLLAEAVDSPEEIIAITFTRKAVQEMKERIIAALNCSDYDSIKNIPHKLITYELAIKVREKDARLKWNILENTNRLRILTIDGLCGYIHQQMPILTGFGAQPKISDDPDHLYQQAAKNLINDPGITEDAMKTLLLHFDNNAQILAGLMSSLLAKREQWLPIVLSAQQNQSLLKEHLESNLSRLINDILSKAKETIPTTTLSDIIELARYAGKKILETSPENIDGLLLKDIESLEACVSSLNDWQAVMRMLVAKNKNWRKTVDKRNGFPKESKAEKEKILAILEQLSCSNEALSIANKIIDVPKPKYQDQQWRILNALFIILPHLCARLHLEFSNQNTIDFNALSLGALSALGTEDQPSDIALQLDYQIKHLLVDEFQDTSVTQYQLLKQLTAHWTPTERRTLFLVGDPMQSIYRFRNAEVGIFVSIQKNGWGDLPFQRLVLRKNFRSTKILVDWLNYTFSSAFPEKDDITNGAIKYQTAVSSKNNDLNNCISYNMACNNERSSEQKILQDITSIRKKYPNDSIAILVRSRNHLKNIIPTLDQHQIIYMAQDIHPLKNQMEIIDLVTLTTALHHPAHKIAWLALCRSPLIGLELSDLTALCTHSMDLPIWYALTNIKSIKNISEDGRLRLQYLQQSINNAYKRQGHETLSTWVRHTWVQLGGPSVLLNKQAEHNTNQFFNLLEQIEDGFSITKLERQLSTLYASADDHADANIHIMTIHKSKGLEFDHVLLPELQAASGQDKDELLAWQEKITPSGHADLLLAPIKPRSAEKDPIHHQIKQLEKEKNTHELVRLFYVACTRAKKGLHLYLSKKPCDNRPIDKKTPIRSGSFLSIIWPIYQSNFEDNAQINPTSDYPTQIDWIETNCFMQRPSHSLILKHSSTCNPPEIQNFPERKLIKNTVQQLLGTLLHETFARIENISDIDIQAEKKIWEKSIRKNVFHADEKDRCLCLLEKWLKSTLDDPVAQWILSNHHGAYNEYPLVQLENNHFKEYRVDRTFIADDNTRWIIDYKTTVLNQKCITSFLNDQKAIYQSQLEQYAKLFQCLEDRPIKLGLYFPACNGWISWPAGASTPTSQSPNYTDPSTIF